LGRGGRDSLAGEPVRAVSCESADGAIRSYFSDATVLSIGHVKRSRLIRRNALGPGQGRGYRLPAIAGGVHRTIPGHSRDNARTADFADPIISGVGKKEIPGTVHCNPFAIGQCGGRSGASITQKAGNAPSSGKVQDPKDIDSANAIRQVSQMLTFPAGIDGEAGGPWQSGSAGVAAIARVTVIARPANCENITEKNRPYAKITEIGDNQWSRWGKMPDQPVY
jgi:hypothetical protein